MFDRSFDRMFDRTALAEHPRWSHIQRHVWLTGIAPATRTPVQTDDLESQLTAAAGEREGLQQRVAELESRVGPRCGATACGPGRAEWRGVVLA